MWRFLVESKVHEYNCLRKLRKILRICNRLIKITRKAEQQPTSEQEVQFTVFKSTGGIPPSKFYFWVTLCSFFIPLLLGARPTADNVRFLLY